MTKQKKNSLKIVKKTKKTLIRNVNKKSRRVKNQISSTKTSKSRVRSVNKRKSKSPKLDVILLPEKNSISPKYINEIKPISDEPKKEKKSGVMYFTQDTENAVVEYNKETDMEKRNTIYNEKIKYAFEKLVENIFNTFKFTYFETSPQEFQKETVTHLVANIEKYNPEKGKAFSYFSIVTKHYLIFHNNNTYKRFNQNVDISDTPSETTVSLQVEDKYYKDTEMSEFMKMMIQYWEKQIGKIFTKQKDLNIANAVIELFRNSDRIEAFNKKALYLYIREISSCKTQQITKVINKMTQYQNNIRKCYINNGVLQNNIYKS